MTPGVFESGLRELLVELVREEIERVREELATPATPPPSDTMNSNEVAAYLRLSRITLENNRSLGKGPPYERAGRRIIYRRSMLDEWLKRGGR